MNFTYAICIAIILLCLAIPFLLIVAIVILTINNVMKSVTDKQKSKQYEEHLANSRHFEDDGAYAEDE